MSADPRQELEFIIAESALMAGSARQALRRSALFQSADDRLITRSKQATARSRDRLANRSPAPEMRRELADLEMADAHIAEARVRLLRQEELIDRLRGRAIATELAERVLETMQDTLKLMVDHRALMRERLSF